MNILGIIPARYQSTRLPGKPLSDLGGKPMIQHVYERARPAVTELWVATDDERIEEAVHGFGGQVMLTSKAHNTGTNRCLEAYHTWQEQYGHPADVVLNIQGDEPLLDPGWLRALTTAFDDPLVQMATLAYPANDPAALEDPAKVFVVLNERKDALYFSRWPIPFQQGRPRENWLQHHTYYQHLGLYAFRPRALQHFASLPPSALETAESLEQNRWLEAGHDIRVEITRTGGHPVDTPEDLERVRQMLPV